MLSKRVDFEFVGIPYSARAIRDVEMISAARMDLANIENRMTFGHGYANLRAWKPCA